MPLRLIHVEDWPISPPPPRLHADSAEHWAEEVLAAAAKDVRLRHPQLDITTRCLSGRPSTVLAAEAGSAGLLVLGSRGLGSVVGFLIGSVSLPTLSATETPVVLVRETDDAEDGSPTRYGAIVVGVDIHQACDKVLAFAFEEAARRGCTMRAVHGWKLPPVFGYAQLLDPATEREVDRSIAEMLDDMLLPWRNKFPEVRLEEKTYVGPAGRELVQASVDADLVVVGRHIRRSALGAHLGPVAHAVLHHTAAPVAILAHD